MFVVVSIVICVGGVQGGRLDRKVSTVLTGPSVSFPLPKSDRPGHLFV